MTYCLYKPGSRAELADGKLSESQYKGENTLSTSTISGFHKHTIHATFFIFWIKSWKPAYQSLWTLYFTDHLSNDSIGSYNGVSVLASLFVPLPPNIALKEKKSTWRIFAGYIWINLGNYVILMTWHLRKVSGRSDSAAENSCLMQPARRSMMTVCWRHMLHKSSGHSLQDRKVSTVITAFFLLMALTPRCQVVIQSARNRFKCCKSPKNKITFGKAWLADDRQWSVGVYFENQHTLFNWSR